MQITGIVVNGIALIPLGRGGTTGFYRAFMNYCIDNYYNEIINSEDLLKRFKRTPNYPDFNRAIDYKRIISYNGLFYTDWKRTDAKVRIIGLIADELGIELNLMVTE